MPVEDELPILPQASSEDTQPDSRPDSAYNKAINMNFPAWLLENDVDAAFDTHIVGPIRRRPGFVKNITDITDPS